MMDPELYYDINLDIYIGLSVDDWTHGRGENI